MRKDRIMIDNQLLNELRGRELVLFVADKEEISQSDVPFPVVYTGMGKMRMFSGLLKWYECRASGGNPTVLNIGSAGKQAIWNNVPTAHYELPL